MALLEGLFSAAPVPAFVEREPWERGFAQLCARDLAPQLAALEMLRRLTLAGIAAAAAIDAVLVYLIVIASENPAHRWEVKPLAVVAGLVITACLWVVSLFVRREQRIVLPVVCRQFGSLEVDVAPKAPTSALEPYWALGLIRQPRSTSRSTKPVKLTVRDLITGAHRAIGLRLVEFDAYDGSSYDLKSMFRGAVLELALPDPGPGNSYAPWHFDRSAFTRIADGLPGEPPAGVATPVTQGWDARGCARPLADGRRVRNRESVRRCVGQRSYREAAEQGDAAAQNIIGNMYWSGSDVAHDYGEAMRWYRKAADQGLARAQYRIGIMYANGWGVPGDLGEARNWMQKAAGGGEQDAKKWLAAQ